MSRDDFKIAHLKTLVIHDKWIEILVRRWLYTDIIVIKWKMKIFCNDNFKFRMSFINKKINIYYGDNTDSSCWHVEVKFKWLKLELHHFQAKNDEHPKEQNNSIEKFIHLKNKTLNKMI